MEKEIKIIELKFKGMDDFNRPIFRDIKSGAYFGSVNKLINNPSDLIEGKNIKDFFTDNPDEIEYFGERFNCEPNGGKASHWEYKFID